MGRVLVVAIDPNDREDYDLCTRPRNLGGAVLRRRARLKFDNDTHDRLFVSRAARCGGSCAD